MNKANGCFGRRVNLIWIVFGLLFVIPACNNGSVPKIPVAQALNRYEINVKDTMWRFYAIIPPQKMQFNKEDYYNGFNGDTLVKTQGGIPGKLLHGKYDVFYPQKNLMESGEFSYGLKTGEWKSWYTGGTLRMVINWKNGKPDGLIKEYSAEGGIIVSGKNRRSSFTGFKIEKLPDGNSRKVWYKNGVSI